MLCKKPSAIQETAAFTVAEEPVSVLHPEPYVLPGKNLQSKRISPRLRDSNGAPWHHQALFQGH